MMKSKSMPTAAGKLFKALIFWLDFEYVLSQDVFNSNPLFKKLSKNFQ